MTSQAILIPGITESGHSAVLEEDCEASVVSYNIKHGTFARPRLVCLGIQVVATMPVTGQCRCLTRRCGKYYAIGGFCKELRVRQVGVAADSGLVKQVTFND